MIISYSLNSFWTTKSTFFETSKLYYCPKNQAQLSQKPSTTGNKTNTPESKENNHQHQITNWYTEYTARKPSYSTDITPKNEYKVYKAKL